MKTRKDSERAQMKPSSGRPRLGPSSMGEPISMRAFLAGANEGGGQRGSLPPWACSGMNMANQAALPATVGGSSHVVSRRALAFLT